MRIVKHLFFSLAALVLIGSCNQAPQVLTNEESVNFAKQMENSIKKGEGEFIDDSFDKSTFVERMKLPGSVESDGYTKGVMQKLNLGKTISASLNDQDSYQFIKHYIKDEKHHVIFRLYSPKQGTLNYHDYELIKANDKCRIADAYIYLSGETLSETMANLYQMLVAKSSDGGKDVVSYAADLKEIRNLVQKGKSSEAKKMYTMLPAYMKKAKAVLLLNVLICSNLSNEEYSEAISEFREQNPNERNINLMMVDGYFLQKDYVKMLGAINSLDSQINKDPLLDYYRYLSYNLLLENANAKTCLLRLLKNIPEFQKGYQELIAVELEGNNKNEADSLIKIYRGKTKFNQEELDNIIAYYRR